MVGEYDLGIRTVSEGGDDGIYENFDLHLQ